MDLTARFLQFALVGAEWVLWVLVGLSIISVYLMLERFLFLRQAAGDPVAHKTLLTQLADGEFDQAGKLTSTSPRTGLRWVGELVHMRKRGPAAIEAALNGTRGGEKLRLERGLSFLGTVGSNAPFIGLFGTVLGIMRAFKDLSASGLQPGQDTVAAVMAGISEALVATAVGLMVAIPAVVAYNLFTRRVKGIMGEAESLAQSALGILIDRHHKGDAAHG